jgi:WD40 repeat protein
MADVFISYSRKDSEFIRRLLQSLGELDRDAWVDWQDIPPTAEWLQEISTAIEAAHAVVFVISPDSVRSEVCRQELELAVKHHKRLVPVVHREVDGKHVPDALRVLNWIFFRSNDDFDTALQTLLHALDTDLDWVRAHTRLLVRAAEWERKQGDRSFVLRGKDLQEAEQWLAMSADMEPKPTSLQTQYIVMSRRVATNRQRVTLGVVTFALIVASVLAFVAWSQRNQAISRELAMRALSQLPVDPESSLRFAQKAVATAETVQAEDALRQSLAESHVRATLRGHTARVRSAAFSHDGKLIVTAGEDHTARIWERESGQQLVSLEGHTGTVYKAVFSPDDTRVVTASADMTARVWIVSTGNLAASLAGHRGWVTDVAFSPDGRFIVTASGNVTTGGAGWARWGVRDSVVRIWDTASGSLVFSLLGPTDAVNAVAFSPDGRWIVAVGDDKTAHVWEASTGRIATALNANDGTLWSAAFSPNGQRLVTAGDRTPRVWEVGTWSKVGELQGHTGRVQSVAFSPDGQRIATAAWDQTARVWEADTAQEVLVLRGHTQGLLSVAFSPDGRFVVTGAQDGRARVWDVAITEGDLRRNSEVQTIESVAELRGHSDVVNTAVFSPDGRWVVTAGWDHTARLWDVNGGFLGELRGHAARARLAAFSPDGRRIVIASQDHSATIWDTESRRRMVTLKGHKGPVSDATFTKDGRFVLTASEDHTARLWDAATGSQTVEFRGHTGKVVNAALSPDESLILTASADGSARIWEVKTGSLQRTLSPPAERMDSAVFSPDGRFVATATVQSSKSGREGLAQVWEVSTGKLVTQQAEKDMVTSAAFSPDGKRVVTLIGAGHSRIGISHRGNNVVRIWDASDGGRSVELRATTGPFVGATFSPDSRFVLTAGLDGRAQIWDASTGQNVLDLRGHSARVNYAAFSPEGRCVLTASADRSTRVWDAISGKNLAVLTGHTGSVNWATFSPDSKLVVTVSDDATARLYACDVCGSLPDLLALAQKRVTQQLTAKEQ